MSVSSLLIPIVFGHRYEDAIPLLAILAWRIPPAVLAGLYGSVLIARDRQVDLMRNSITVAIFVVVADVVAILVFGLIGAAVVSVAAGVLAFLLNARSVSRVAPDLDSGGGSGSSVPRADEGRSSPITTRGSRRSTRATGGRRG